MSAFIFRLTIFACILVLARTTLAQTETCEFRLFHYGQPALMTPSGINKFDAVVGTYFNTNFRARGFIRSRDGRVRSYQVPNLPAGQSVWFMSINDKGQIVGEVALRQQSGFLLEGEDLTGINFPGASWTIPYSINNNGEIVGSYVKGNQGGGFLYKNSRFTTLQVPGSLGTAPSGINDAGVIVGSFSDSQLVNHGFVMINKKYVALDFPGASWTTLAGINNKGEIIGNYALPPGPVLGFVYKAGQFETVTVPGMYSAQALAINEQGDLAGLTFATDYTEQGFLGTECR